MSKEIYISSTPHETRLAIVENDALTEIYYERENEYTLAGSIYNGRVTRVLPGMQSSFVDIGLERDAFLYITDFMEEAPDSAEFDTTSHADHAPRAPRPVIAAERAEPTPEASARPEGSSRGNERGERSEGGRRSRRGGRDRDRNASGNRDRTQQNGAESQQRPPLPEVVPTAPQTSEIPESYASPSASDASEIGEGAPGADGSRRWRGRRGRRRGRGTPGQPGTPQETSALLNADTEQTFEIDGAAVLEIAAAPPEPVAPVQAAPSGDAYAPRRDERAREGNRRDEGRREWRGEGRGREEGRGAGRDSEARAQRGPRGFAPSADLYKVGGEQSSSTGPLANAYGEPDAPAEPIILPGESLSKYRKGGDEPSASAGSDKPTITLAPPANLYTLAAGWDGGATLPGETLSRRTPSEGRSEARPQGSEGRRESGREGRRDGRRQGREPRAEVRSDDRAGFRNPPPEVPQSPAQVVQDFDGPSVAETPEEQPEVARAGHPEDFAAEEILHEADPASIPPPAEENSAEYEPSDASASYRVDPVPVREYRQSAPVIEEMEEIVDPPPSEFAEPEVATDHEPVAQQAHEAEAVEPVHSIAHTVTPDPEIPAHVAPEQELPEPVVDEHAAHTGEAMHHTITESFQASFAAHDVTSILNTGEMMSEPMQVVSAIFHEPAPMEVAEPASPMHHEGAVVSPEVEAGQPSEGVVSSVAASESISEQEPEEEFLEEEEPESATLQASSIEEMDDFDEQETLEGAADLSTMLREMSIDQITRPSPTIGGEDEDDLSEEDLAEDSEEFEMDESHDDTEEDAESEESSDLQEEEAARTGSASDAAFFEAQFGQAGSSAESGSSEHRNSGTSSQDAGRREPRRDGGRRDGRRGSRDRNERGDRPRSTGGSGDRERSGGQRRSMQSTNLPAISDLLKPGQEILCQIAKEPIAKKGARITSHIALPGRFLVFMPTVNHTGVSRKIESDGERRRLKEILLSEKGEASGGFIVRTAASGASEEELRSDLRFLLNLWADIKARSESSKSPALIYHDLNLIERILRDQVTDNFSAIWVDTETEYERVLRFLQRFQPALIRRVKLYSKETPMFEQFGITEEINKALRSKVWLKSGGSIVINQTEALVAIDINTGKFVGKTARLEDTIVKTNLDAIPEIVRQIRLRDLGGIIIIDFIDMDERKNRNKVMAALEEELKSDRAPSKVLQFNDFGLVAITRKRVKQSLERTLSTTCEVCTGTGMVKSPITVCNDIYVEMRKMHKHLDRGDVMLRVHPEVVKQLKTSGSKWLQEMEEMCGKTILVKSDPSLHPEQFDIH